MDSAAFHKPMTQAMATTPPLRQRGISLLGILFALTIAGLIFTAVQFHMINRSYEQRGGRIGSEMLKLSKSMDSFIRRNRSTLSTSFSDAEVGSRFDISVQTAADASKTISIDKISPSAARLSGNALESITESVSPSNAFALEPLDARYGVELNFTSPHSPGLCSSISREDCAIVSLLFSRAPLRKADRDLDIQGIKAALSKLDGYGGVALPVITGATTATVIRFSAQDVTQEMDNPVLGQPAGILAVRGKRIDDENGKYFSTDLGSVSGPIHMSNRDIHSVRELTIQGIGIRDATISETARLSSNNGKVIFQNTAAQDDVTFYNGTVSSNKVSSQEFTATSAINLTPQSLSADCIGHTISANESGEPLYCNGRHWIALRQDGAVGVTGETGKTGDDGVAGNQGPAGERGTEGPKGIKGKKPTDINYRTIHDDIKVPVWEMDRSPRGADSTTYFHTTLGDYAVCNVVKPANYPAIQTTVYDNKWELRRYWLEGANTWNSPVYEITARCYTVELWVNGNYSSSIKLDKNTRLYEHYRVYGTHLPE